MKKYKSELNISVLTKLSWQIVAEDACEVLAVRFGKVRHDVRVGNFPVETSWSIIPQQKKLPSRRLPFISGLATEPCPLVLSPEGVTH